LFDIFMDKNKNLRSSVLVFSWIFVVLVFVALSIVVSRLPNRTSPKVSPVSESSGNTSGLNGKMLSNPTHLGSSIKSEPKPGIISDNPAQPTRSRIDPVEYLEFTQRSGREAFVEIFSILTKHDPCKHNTDFALTLTALTYADLRDANDLFRLHWGHIVDQEIIFQLQELSPGVHEPDISVNRDHILDYIDDLEVTRRKREFVIRRILNAGVALSREELTSILKIRPNQSLGIDVFTRFEDIEWYDSNHLIFRSESRNSGNLKKSQNTQPAALPWNLFRSPADTRGFKP
jgi:hypothetical protein